MRFDNPAFSRTGHAGPGPTAATIAETVGPAYFSRADRRDWRNRRFLRKRRAHDVKGA